MKAILGKIDPARPVLIAGPTASGKSALALAIAEAQGGVIVNADASQIYDCWRVITARPSPDEEARAPHVLYGHVAYDVAYSVGHWLRQVEPLLSADARPIIVGGTGLYFTALLEGLAEIPATPVAIRAEADAMSLAELLGGIDASTAAALDQNNRARVQRAWEVERATGRSLRDWQQDETLGLLDKTSVHRVLMNAPKDWLTPRIEARFDQMIAGGALEEIDAMADRYDPGLASCRAIGVPELMAYRDGRLSLEAAREKASISTRQYAKRQRTWFKARFADWEQIDVPSLRFDR